MEPPTSLANPITPKIPAGVARQGPHGRGTLFLSPPEALNNGSFVADTPGSSRGGGGGREQSSPWHTAPVQLPLLQSWGDPGWACVSGGLHPPLPQKLLTVASCCGGRWGWGERQPGRLLGGSQCIPTHWPGSVQAGSKPLTPHPPTGKCLLDLMSQ